MAQLKVKQILDFVTAVGGIHDATVGAAAVTAISTAKSDALSSAYSADVVAKSEALVAAQSADSVLSTAVVGQISTAKSEAISAALSADSTLSSAISTEKARIDALLLNSTAALDTFAEIEGFITSLETSDVSGLSAALSTAVSNDAVHTSDIAAINGTIGAYGDIVAYDRADFATAAQGALADSAVQNLGDLSITATATELNQLDNVTLGDIVTYSASDFTAATAFNTLAGRVDTLEALDVVQQVGTFVDTRTFSLPFGVSTSDNNIAVFINGLQIHEYNETSSPDGYTTVDGTTFALTNLGYDLEADDHIIVLGVIAA